MALAHLILKLKMSFLLCLYLVPILQGHERDPRCPYAFVNSSYCAEMRWIKGPIVEDESQAQIHFWKWTDRPGPRVYSDPPSFQFIPFMPHHGHGTSPVQMDKIRDGVYRVSQIYFTMSGSWMISLIVDGEEEREFLTIP